MEDHTHDSLADKVSNNRLMKELSSYENAIEKSRLANVTKATLRQTASDTVGIFCEILSGNLPAAGAGILKLFARAYEIKEERQTVVRELRGASYVYNIRKAFA